MEEDVGEAVVGYNEPVPFRRIEPLDHPADLDQINGCILARL